jgi:hypothetical protein
MANILALFVESLHEGTMHREEWCYPLLTYIPDHKIKIDITGEPAV